VVQPNGTGLDRLQYVGQVGLGQRGPSLHIGWDRMGLGQVVFRLGGTGWDWDSGVSRLTCLKVGLQGREIFVIGQPTNMFDI